MLTDKLSAQAKAIAAAVLTLLAQIGVIVGQGGLDQLKTLTLGAWIQVVLQTATLYGFTYMIPNYTKAPAVVVSPADPQV